MAKTINGMEFELSAPYAEGHTVNAIEARVLNQTRAENIGNNARAKIKEMQDAGKTEDEIREYVAGVDANYEFTAAGVSASRKLDPVEREANKIARDLLKAHLATSGRKLTVAPEGLTDEEWDDKVSAEVERIAGLDEVLAAAKKAVAAKQKQADTLANALGDVNV
jgi:DNA repair ATPase RecN